MVQPLVKPLRKTLGGTYMKNFRTLDLAVEFYDKTLELNLKGNLRDQLERAASSISLNLSEGNAKRTVKEKKRYYHTAYASTQECKTILRLIKNKDMELEDMIDKLGASIYRLMKSDLRALRNTVLVNGVPNGSRTRVSSVKGMCPRPLDDRDS